MNMVVEAPLASNPPRRWVPTEQRTKSRHDPKNKPVAQPEVEVDVEPAKVSKAAKPKTTVAKPGHSYAQIGTKKTSEAELRKSMLMLPSKDFVTPKPKLCLIKKLKRKRKLKRKLLC